MISSIRRDSYNDAIKKIKGKRRSKKIMVRRSNTMPGQKSGPALTGPAAPVTTALKNSVFPRYLIVE